MVGLTKDMTYLLPATQTDLSDVLGLSLVHTNRTCAILRSEGLATFARRTVTIHNWDKLQRVAEFNPEYCIWKPSRLSAEHTESSIDLYASANKRKNLCVTAKIKFGLYIFFNIPWALRRLLSAVARGRFLRFMRG
jgi:hypothetical protein